MQRPVARRLGSVIVSLIASLATGLTASAQSADPPTTIDEEPIPLRRPQGKPQTYVLPPIDPKQVPPPEPLLPRESLPVPDRWRIMESLGLKDRPWNPYVQNTLKGDKPSPLLASWGPDWFVNLAAISDTVYEARRLPTPVGPQSSDRPGANDVFSRGRQGTFSQTVLMSASLIKGDTSFRPPDYEFRLVAAFNGNVSHAQEVRVLDVDPRDGKTRTDGFVGIQEAFADIHLRNVSELFDFESVRVGIQPFNSDFRGFVFQDQALGVRLFGTRDNNRWQYNLGWFRRVEKDTNSGLNDLGRPLRRDDTFVANLFRQDFPVQGHTTQLTVLHNVNREDDTDFYDANGFLKRPAVIGDTRAHRYHATYVGLNGDGHFGAWNLTSSVYGVFGQDSRNPIAQRDQRISAGFAALELSRDFDWIRVRGSGLVASGDRNPYDGRASGFDAIFENPQIAGSDTSFFIRQAVPLIGGGGVSLSGRNGVLPDLRSSKDQGQSNFVNPGLLLFGIGADFDITPQLRLITNVSSLRFLNTSALQVLRAQANIDRDIGIDVSAALQYRPFQTQNIVLNTSVAGLIPGKGFRQLYDASQAGRPYSVLFNLILRY